MWEEAFIFFHVHVNEDQKKHHKLIVTEIEPLICFYEAEEYYQKYLRKNPNGYCHIDLNI